jgi:hypothetical protein
MKTKKLKFMQAIIFNDINGLCFIKCPICKEDILVRDDKWVKCKNARNKEHSKRKVVYRFSKNKIIEAEVENYSHQSGLKSLDWVK